MNVNKRPNDPATSTPIKTLLKRDRLRTLSNFSLLFVVAQLPNRREISLKVKRGDAVLVQ